MASPLFGAKARGGTPLFDVAGPAPSSHPHRSGGGFIDNLIGDVRDTLVGLPTGLVMTAEHPIRSLEDMGKTTWHDWSPLFHGDVKEFAKNFYDHPLGPILDVAAVFSGGAGAVGKAARFSTAVEFSDALKAATGAGALDPEVAATKALSRRARIGRHQYIEIPAPVDLGGRSYYKELSANPLTRQMEKGMHELGLQLGEHVPKFFSRFTMEQQYARQLAKRRSIRGATAGAIRRSVTSEIAGIAEQRAKKGGLGSVAEGEALPKMTTEPAHIEVPSHQGLVPVTERASGKTAWVQPWQAEDMKSATSRTPMGMHNVPGYIMQKPADSIWQDERGLYDVGKKEPFVAHPAKDVAEAARGHQISHFMEAGKTLSEDPRHMYRVVEGVMYMNALRTAERMTAEHMLEGGKAPVGWKFMRAEAHHKPFDAVTPEGVEAGMATWAKRNTTGDITQAAKDENGHFMMVRDGEIRALAQEAQNSAKTLRMLWEKPTQVWKWTVLATRPAFFVNNTVGNLLMANAALGPAEFAKSMITAIRNAHGVTGDIQRTMSLDRKTAKAIRHTLGDPNDVIDQLYMGPHRLGFGQEQMAGSPTWFSKRLKKNGAPRSVWKAARGLEQGFLPITHRVAESWVRRVLLESYLRKSEVVRAHMRDGLGFQDAVRKASESTNFRIQMEKRVANALGDYHHLNPMERKLRQIIPFYTWDRAIMRHTAHLAKDRPFTAAYLAETGGMGTEETKKLLGDIPRFMHGYLPLSLLGVKGHGGGRVATLSTQGINPYATVPDVVETAAALVSHPKNVQLGSVIASQVNPLVTGAIEQTTGQSLLSGARVPEAPGGILGGAVVQTFKATPPATVLDRLLSGTPEPHPNKRTGKTKPFLAQKDLRHLLEGYAGVPVKNISPQAAENLARQESGRKKRKRAKNAAKSVAALF